MDYDSLDADQRKAYRETTAGTHHREVELVLIRRHDDKPVMSLTNRFLGGSVEGDADLTPVTALECEILDDEFELDWAHGRHRRYAVQVVDSRFVPDLDTWVEATIFTGPLWNFERQGVVVRLEADGAERDALGSIREAETWPARTKATTVIRHLLDAAGFPASLRHIPAMRTTLPRDVTVGVKRGRDRNPSKRGFQGKRRRILRVGHEDTYWGEMEPVAEATGRDLFADGRGRIVLRKPVRRPQFSLTDRMILSPVKEDRGEDSEETTNTWIVLGADPKGPKKRVHGRAALPRRHPSSAWSLRKHGKPRQVIEVVENRHVRSNRKADELAERRRSRAMRETVTHEVEALPVTPWIRPLTLGRVPVRSGKAVTRVRRWTLPLGPGADPLTIGAVVRRKR